VADGGRTHGVMAGAAVYGTQESGQNIMDSREMAIISFPSQSWLEGDLNMTDGGRESDHIHTEEFAVHRLASWLVDAGEP
jgi:hypothetical protein